MKEPIEEGIHGSLAEALRRLREADAGQAAPKSLEGEMLQAFRAHHAVETRGRKWMWAPAAIAAGLVFAVVSRLYEPAQMEAPSVPLAAVTTEAPQAGLATPVSPPKAAAKSPQRKRRPQRSLRLAQAAPITPATPREEPFVEIPYAPSFTAYDEGQVVRVNMRGSSARRLGLPVMADRVQADLLVGNDGMARAIRLVSNSNR